MKTLFFSIVLCVVCMSIGNAQSQDQTPAIDQRHVNQEKRIKEGEKSGQLTPREARKLQRQQRSIDKQEAREKAKGPLTQGQKAQLNRRENRASRNIYRKKHNARVVPNSPAATDGSHN
jgi:hypothetical protein